MKDMPIAEIVDEAVLTYNNSIHSTTKLSPFELITGHIHKSQPFPSKPDFIAEQEYLQKHIENYRKLAKIIQEQSLNKKQNYVNKCNRLRKDPANYNLDEIIFKLDDRRNKLAPRFNKHIVTKNNKITIETNKGKVHKQKIRKKKL